MFSSEVAGTSHEAFLHGQSVTALWHSQSLTQKFSKAASAALMEVQTLVVGTEHTLESIAEYFQILPFHHHIMNRNLVGCELTLHPHGHLEIKRPDEKYATSFPVSRLQLA
jgi:hypothetical protein